MLDPELIEAQNAYRRPLSIKEENALVEKLVDTNWDEHQVRKGDPSKPTYYIIRRKWAGGGIFSYFNSVAGQIRYAMQKDWIPVVDMQNYPNIFLNPQSLVKKTRGNISLNSLCALD